MTDGATAGASPNNRTAIGVTCAAHKGPRGFASLVVEKQGGEVGRGPSVSGDPTPRRRPLRWGLSSADWYAHAVEEDAQRRAWVHIARCGHRLRGASVLHDEPPTRICPSCAELTEPPPACPERAEGGVG